MLLLDTCALYWLSSEQTRLSAHAAVEMRARPLFVSAISAYEIGQKVRTGKLRIPQPIDLWFPSVLRLYRVTELPVSAAIAALATQFPSPHRDPFDRIIAATAQVHSLPVVTPDPLLAGLAPLTSVW